MAVLAGEGRCSQHPVVPPARRAGHRPRLPTLLLAVDADRVRKLIGA
ncbi:hypothetical protein ACQP1V_28570 [Microtetraspora malaysiensis]